MNRDSASSLARQARQLIRSKRYREAFTLAAQARDQSPRCSQVRFNFLWTFFLSRKATRALPISSHKTDRLKFILVFTFWLESWARALLNRLKQEMPTPAFIFWSSILNYTLPLFPPVNLLRQSIFDLAPSGTTFGVRVGRSSLLDALWIACSNGYYQTKETLL